MDCALLNANLIPSLLVVKVAAWKALADAKNGTLMTKTVHSELVYNLGPDYAITKSLQTFGIAEETKHILACFINVPEEKIAEFIPKVKGKLIASNVDEELKKIFDKGKVLELYEITKEEQNNSIENAVINRISCKISKKLELE